MEQRLLPSEFAAMLTANPAFSGLAEALSSTDSPTSIRINRAKNVSVDAAADIVPWCPAGVYLPERPSFTLDPRLHQGLYYVQDASSMVLWHIAQAIGQELGALRWLDACAAPGGKTTAVADALPQGSLIVANEFDPKRLQALVENVERWGNPSVAVTRGDTKCYRRLSDFFDVVAVDAPCSGEGMMRKEPEAIAQWSPRLTEHCALLQREIVANVWLSLRPGGYLIYSTCTFNTTENEENVRYIIDELGGEPVDFGLDKLPGVAAAVVGNLPVGRFMPGRVRGEGLFVAIIRKPGDGQTSVGAAKSKAEKKKQNRKSAEIPHFLPRCDKYTYAADAEGVTAIPTEHVAALSLLGEHAKGARIGVRVAEVKGRDMVPTLALCRLSDFDPAMWHNVEIDYPTALAFLRGEALKLSDDTPRGLVLLTYDGRALGWVKNLGNRANNLLPDNRRIHSRNVPPSLPLLPIHNAANQIDSHSV